MLQQDEIRNTEFLMKIKKNLVDKKKRQEEYDTRKKEEEVARKQERLDKGNPHQNEINLCDHLILYCKKLAGIETKEEEEK
jgi:hypothetical protein